MQDASSSLQLALPDPTPRGKAATAPRHFPHDVVDAPQHPLAPLIARQPLLTLHALPLASLLKRLLQPIHMASDLGRDALLRSQARDRDHGREHAPDLVVACDRREGRVGQKSTVVRGEDVDREVRVRLGELDEQLLVVRRVD